MLQPFFQISATSLKWHEQHYYLLHLKSHKGHSPPALIILRGGSQSLSMALGAMLHGLLYSTLSILPSTSRTDIGSSPSGSSQSQFLAHGSGSARHELFRIVSKPFLLPVRYIFGHGIGSSTHPRLGVPGLPRQPETQPGIFSPAPCSKKAFPNLAMRPI